ncbi:MAG: PIG-L family deacetylase [Rubrivivax sp.]|nr:PIG-L family deacetylase [Rubrivivax sp.]
MRDLGLNLPTGANPQFLFLGAHSDDIEIGCGGTVIELLKSYPRARVHWVVLSTGAGREVEARQASASLLAGVAEATVEIKEFRGAYFPAELVGLKDYFEDLKRRVRPDVIFTHAREELHQDHRIVGELTWNTWRNHMILEYEIPKYDGGLGSPSVFVRLDEGTVRRKVDMLMEAFRTQHDKAWFTPSTFEALMRLRGVECNAPSGYAEAFYCRKLVFGRTA